MHGLIAGLWSSLSGAGRFVSRAGSGFLVDTIGFNWTAAIAAALQGGVVSDGGEEIKCQQKDYYSFLSQTLGISEKR